MVHQDGTFWGEAKEILFGDPHHGADLGFQTGVPGTIPETVPFVGGIPILAGPAGPAGAATAAGTRAATAIGSRTASGARSLGSFAKAHPYLAGGAAAGGSALVFGDKLGDATEAGFERMLDGLTSAIEGAAKGATSGLLDNPMGTIALVGLGAVLLGGLD